MDTNIKIIDCFIFYNELEILTYRLNILHNIVDYFILVESTHTFVGKEKKLYFNENKHLFEKFKIIHIIISDFPYKYPKINFKNNEQWQNEFYQRNSILQGLKKINLNDQDLIIISDVDEIPDPLTLENCKNGTIKVTFNSLEMDFYNYNLTTLINKNWYSSKIISYNNFKKFKSKSNSIRYISKKISVPIPKGGWHLSYFGNSQFINNKIINFSHQELNIPNFTDIKKIEDKIKNGQDLFDRKNNKITKISITDNKYLPIDYDKYLIFN